MSLKEGTVSFTGGVNSWSVQCDGKTPVGVSDLQEVDRIYEEDYLASTQFGVPPNLTKEELLKLADSNADLPAGSGGIAARFTKGALTPTPKVGK